MNTYNPFLLEKLEKLFSKSELQAFITASDEPRPTIIRCNKLRIKRKELAKLLIGRGMDVDVLEWCDDALIVYNSQVPIGATPEFLTGLYVIQGAASLLPVINLMHNGNTFTVKNKNKGEGIKTDENDDGKKENPTNKKEFKVKAQNIDRDEKILDMCAAPGGKSSHISALMQNKGILFAYDINASRIKALQSNLFRLGISNTVIVNSDALKNHAYNSFDRILLDAPCSGTGIISKDPSVKVNRSYEDIKKTVKTQKGLIAHAFKLLKPNGVLVYSTCSVFVDENEMVVDYLLKKNKNAKLTELRADIGLPGFVKFRGEHFHPSLKMCRRIYPHVNNMDGFFVARLTKFK